MKRPRLIRCPSCGERLYGPKGRPAKISEATKFKAIFMRKQGHTYRAIVERLKISYGMAHKIIKEGK